MRTRLLIAFVLLILLTPVALVGALLYTETGVQLLAQQLSKFPLLRIQGVSGALSGPLRIARFELNHPRVHVVVHDIVLEPQLRGLLLQSVQLSSATARDALVEIRAVELPESDRPPRFLPAWLRVDARGVELQHVRYVHMNGTSVEADSVRGRVTITSRQLRVRGFEATADWFNARGDLRLRASKPLGLRARVAGAMRLPRTELVLNASAHGDLARLELQGELLEPERVSVQGAFIHNEDEPWRLEGVVNSPQFGLEPFIERPPFSLRDVALNVTMTPAEVHAVGSLRAPELAAQDFTVDARGRYANRTLELDSADFGVVTTTTAVHARGKIAFVEDGPALDLALRWRDLQWPFSGEALVVSSAGEGALHGVLPYAFDVNAAVAGPKLPAAEGVARGLLAKDHVDLEQYDLQTLDGRLTGSGSVQWSTPRAWRLSTTAANLNPGVLRKDLPGQLNFSLSAEGAGFDKRATFKANVDALSGTLRGLSVRGGGRVQRTAKEWVAQDVDVRYGRAHATLSGRLNERVDARWRVHAPSLAELWPDAAGSLESSGLASGSRQAPHIVGRVSGEKLRYQQWMADRLRIDADVDASNANPSRLSINAERIGRDKPLLSELHINGEGVADDHRVRLEVSSVSAEESATPMRAVLQARGALAEQVWKATLTSAQFTRGAQADQKLELVEPARLVVSRTQAQLEGMCLGVSKGRVCAEGDWSQTGAWRGVLSGYEIPLAFVLPPSGPEAEYGGRIEGRVELHGAPNQAWQGSAGMRIVDAAIIYRPEGAEAQTLNLGTGGLAATATPARIDFSFGVQAFTDTFLYANAHIAREQTGELLDMPLNGDVRARAADANILPLVFPEIDRAAGLLTANAQITGSLGAPEINGRIELARGEFDSYRVNLAMRELELTANLVNEGMSFRGAGKLGQGRLEADGAMNWREARLRGDLHVRGDNLLVADLPEYRVVASPDLRFNVDGVQMRVSGDVKIPSALIQPNRLSGAVRASDDARYVGEHAAERDGRLSVDSNIRIVMGDDVRVDAFGLTGRITGGVTTMLQTGEAPLGRGELGVADGRYEAYGQKLDITRGRLLFEGSAIEDPGLDIEARRQIETTMVGVNVRGTLQAPRLTFFSDPAMPQTQIVSYLVTGKSVDDMQSGDAATMAATKDTVALQGGSLLASQLGRRIGLQDVGVESSTGEAGETNTSLVLGKFLSPRLYISYGISLTESINTLKLRYTITDKWIIRTESGEAQSADVEYTFER